MEKHKQIRLKNLNPVEENQFWEFSIGKNEKLSHQYIHHAFEDQVRVNPQALAAIHLQEKITYLRLNELSEYLATHLYSLDCGVEKNIGLFIERSIPMLIGIMGILKTGASYVPQDARITPTSQLSHIIKTSDIKVVLTLSHLKHRIPMTKDLKVIALDELFCKIKPSKMKFETLPKISNHQNNCFILYTSGTTGLPNGVKVTHRNLCNIILTAPGNLGVKSGDKVSQLLNISFDMAAWEIFSALCHGGTLVIRDKSIQETASQVNIIIATPSILATIDPLKNPQVKTVATAGEPCPVKLAKVWANQSNFYNCCGPTETTIVNTMQLIDKNFTGRISIGKPTPNNTVYILDEKMNPCSIGEIGEMWAGGFCVTNGYIKNKKLTRERYKPDPFIGGDHLMFQTRDLGRWNERGELEHFGRTDDQIKIKGFRVELDSISAVLESIPGVQQAVTIKLDSENLVSFIRPGKIDYQKAKRILGEKLPYYSLPALIIPELTFPKTNRGKIDKKALTIIAVDHLHRFKDKHLDLIGDSNFQRVLA